MNTYITELHSRVDSSQLFTVSLADTSKQANQTTANLFPEYDIYKTTPVLPGETIIIDSETWESESADSTLSTLASRASS